MAPLIRWPGRTWSSVKYHDRSPEHIHRRRRNGTPYSNTRQNLQPPAGSRGKSYLVSTRRPAAMFSAKRWAVGAAAGRGWSVVVGAVAVVEAPATRPRARQSAGHCTSAPTAGLCLRRKSLRLPLTPLRPLLAGATWHDSTMWSTTPSGSPMPGPLTERPWAAVVRLRRSRPRRTYGRAKPYRFERCGCSTPPRPRATAEAPAPRQPSHRRPDHPAGVRWLGSSPRSRPPRVWRNQTTHTGAHQLMAKSVRWGRRPATCGRGRPRPRTRRFGGGVRPGTPPRRRAGGGGAAGVRRPMRHALTVAASQCSPISGIMTPHRGTGRETAR